MFDFLWHPHVITQDATENENICWLVRALLRQKGVEFFETSRGRRCDLSRARTDCGVPDFELGADPAGCWFGTSGNWKKRMIARRGFGIVAGREAGKTGVWVGEEKTSEEIAAIGVHISRWVTSLAWRTRFDGLAEFRFDRAVRNCGPEGRPSLEKLLGRSVKLDEVKPKLAAHFAEVFGLELQRIDRAELLRGSWKRPSNRSRLRRKDWQRRANGENAHTAAASGSVLLHAAEPRRGRPMVSCSARNRLSAGCIRVWGRKRFPWARASRLRKRTGCTDDPQYAARCW